MQETTQADREHELRELLDTLEAHPEKSLPQHRARVAILQEMLGAHERA